MTTNQVYLHLDNFYAMTGVGFTFAATIDRATPNIATMVIEQYIPVGLYSAQCDTYRPAHRAVTGEEAEKYIQDLLHSTWLDYEADSRGVYGRIDLHPTFEGKYPGCTKMQSELTLELTVDRELYTGDVVQFALIGPISAVWTHVDHHRGATKVVPLPTSAVMTLPPGDMTFYTS